MYPDGTVFMHLELIAADQDGHCPEEVQDLPGTRIASSNPIADVTMVDTGINSSPFTSAGGSILNSYTPATYAGRGSKRCQTASNPPPVHSNDDGSMTLGDDNQDDDDDAHTMYSQTTMDAARARANAVLDQADQAELKMSSAPPESSLQKAAIGTMGHHDDKDDL